MGSQRVSVRTLLVVTLVVAVGTAAATTIVTQADPDPVAGVEGELRASENLTVTNQGLQYVGTNVTAVNLTVQNSHTDSITGTVYLAIYDANGDAVATRTVDKTFVSGEASVLIDLAGDPAVADVVTIEATIEE
ncbi:hypothetical protein ACFQPA_10620 [Halomarina halobia]|uniref:DUF3426 domain-containing protein n=1 Tax=Halomarina halobia TaxID=3033386 RepID=A0ABD6ABR8_9EURY|nr:hypothetical protein [Halomarina sp. PSR21]